MIAIVDYEAGNLRSVKRACDALGLAAQITGDPDAVARAERIVFPGVGASPSAVASLRRTGLFEALRTAHGAGAPFLGICVGAQLVLDWSEEGDIACLGLVEGATRRLRPGDPALKVPHMGWNGVAIERPHPLLEGVRDGDEFYFVHAYVPDPADPACVYATADHGVRFCAALGRGNLFATQFHPEKSGRLGLALLERFSKWDGGDGAC